MSIHENIDSIVLTLDVLKLDKFKEYIMMNIQKTLNPY